MTRSVRVDAFLVVVAVVLILLTGGSARAAEPQIGGKLSAGGGSVLFTSSSTMAVRVTFEGEAVKVEPAIVVVAPGATVEASYREESSGMLAAHLEAVTPVTGGQDTATATLVVNLKPSAAPPAPAIPWGPIGGAVVILAALALALRRLRPWRWRIVTS